METLRGSKFIYWPLDYYKLRSQKGMEQCRCPTLMKIGVFWVVTPCGSCKNH
jgi:hypothetical protein